MEIWVNIKGYNRLYKVSSKGRIKSLPGKKVNSHGVTTNTRILKPQLQSNGYLTINLVKNGKMKTHSIHRLVALHFIKNHNNLPQVNHKDCDKTNNAVPNLEWVTGSNNMLHAKANGIWNHPKGFYNNLSKGLIQYSLDGELINRWGSIREASKGLGINRISISRCLSGKNKKSHGFIFKKIEK